ncbi:sensor histidine kinase N-terminal domain-containing protein (plasmid) [Thioclava litoralis]|uniref:histidine kinase n=1 Tax=Thioclava litoralis TaxID=3076557 RepID=A0ABZ1E3H8_9RHOB|nr:sensor histidine kinase N-terminal domain-containing protein [Thioclava sp. FTW29]
MSIKLRLFLILTASTLIVWFSAVVWIEHVTRAQVEKVLDARLMEAARMVASLVESSDMRRGDSAQTAGALSRGAQAAGGQAAGALLTGAGYTQQQFCQIWSLSGQMIGRSEDAPDGRLLSFDQTGFHDVTSQGKALRVYAIVNPDLRVQVTVGDSLEMRDRLVHGVVEGLALPALVVLPLMGGLIWWSTGRGLKPLERLAKALGHRHIDDAGQIPQQPATPREIRPVIAALNDLLARLHRARRREKDFVSYAAHEMKTPLAGLKMQAYVARHAPDEAARLHALQAIEYSVTRTDRMVRQLLDLAQIENRPLEPAALDLAALAREQMISLTDMADAKGVGYALEAPERPMIRSDAVLLGLAIRNLVENAIHATAAGGQIGVEVCLRPEGVELAVYDGGPGLPPELAGRIGEKFLRPSAAGGLGSGLGLAITSDALALLGCRLVCAQTARGHKMSFLLPPVHSGVGL